MTSSVLFIINGNTQTHVPPSDSDDDGAAAGFGAGAAETAAGFGALSLGASKPFRVGASAGAVFPPIDGRGVSLTTFFTGTSEDSFLASFGTTGSTFGLDVRDGRISSFPVRDLMEDKSCSS